ncbi:META domain-containing protein [Chitinophaga japonensis]|uniref:META domain-containing protein n=1 Tax=Chitinophaga japonensis TaxID=104662 RepID=A0A562TEL0_CHIJA|nr:META domain-containing protein [Chitinophaga japonensis]TWI91823.1 META domain-containing protein [Chitinophaga japonensis]
MFTKLVLTATVVLLANTCNNRQAATEKNEQDTAATAQVGATQPDPWAFIQKKRWNLIQLDGNTLTALPNPIWLEFDTAEHRFTGHGGCNRLSGNYEADNRQIQFKQVISTRMACLSDSANERESTFLRLLNDHIYTFDIAEQTLNLYDSGKVVLMFGMQDKPVEPVQ